MAEGKSRELRVAEVKKQSTPEIKEGVTK